MNYDQALEILRTIREMYGDHKFPMTKRKVNLMISQLETMDYDKVMSRVEEHVRNSPYPPALCDIAVYEVPDNGMSEKMKQWEKEAAEVPEETKRLFEEKLNELIRKVSQ